MRTWSGACTSGIQGKAMHAAALLHIRLRRIPQHLRAIADRACLQTQPDVSSVALASTP